MTKKVFFAALSGLLAFASCKEVRTVIPNNNNNDPSADTTYTATPEDTTVRKVLMEEFTGVTCPNCPKGHALISGYEAANPGRIIAIGYYAFGQSQTEPVSGLTQQDFRNNIATDLGNNFFGGVPFLPSGCIDRVPPHGNGLLDDRNYWSGMISSRLAVSTPLNIHITSAYDPSTRTDTIVVTVAVTKAISKKLNLSVSIIENNILDAQEDTDPNNGNAIIDTLYQHNHVMRDMLTSNSGSPIFSSYDATSKAPGLVYRRKYVYTVNSAWKPENCKIVAFVNNNETNDKEVAQAEETDMK